MLESIRDLTTARPHMRKTAQFSPEQYQAYQEGYYTGVIYALRVADLAVARYKLTTKVIRAGRKRKASA